MIALEEIPDSPDEPEPLTVEIPTDLYAKWFHAREKVAAWTEIAKGLRAQIEEHLGDAVVATIHGTPVIKWGYRQTHRLDQRSLKHDHPELFERYYKPAEERRFEPLDSVA